jgi:hypothetical protein
MENEEHAMMNLPENSKTPSAGPVGDNSAALASQFTGALPTCAPDALIIMDRAELNSFWPEGIKNFKPRETWQNLCALIEFLQPKPALN